MKRFLKLFLTVTSTILILSLLPGCTLFVSNLKRNNDENVTPTAISDTVGEGETKTSFIENRFKIKPEERVSYIKNWQFQYNSETSDYSVFFALLDENNVELAASGAVYIKIEDEDGNFLYDEIKYFNEEDFGNYTSELRGDQFLANIKIDKSEVEKGTSENGTVYLTVYNDDYYYFDEVNCSALYCLPLREITLETEKLPKEVLIKDYSGNLQSKMKINEVTYLVEYGMLKITVKGEKTYGKDNSGYDIIKYKIYDSEGYVLEASSIYVYSLGKGDKFKEDTLTIFDVKPGDSYQIKFFDYE